MMTFSALDRLHRLEKLLLEDGTAKSAAEARALLTSYTIQIMVGSELEGSAPLQVALLTAVNTARRAIHGEVRVVGDLRLPLDVPIPRCRSIQDAVELLGGVVETKTSRAHALLLGSVPPPRDVVALRACMSGFRGGVVPAEEEPLLLTSPPTTLAGAVAGAVGISEIFQALRGVNARAAQRSLGYSVWDPGADWLTEDSDEPDIAHLPTSVWVVGLGHLGQSLLWNLNFLPYADRAAVRIVLQDYDILKPANVSTSPLSFIRDLGHMKTRVAAQWMEDAGFQTKLVERRFAADFKLNGDEPRLAFFGVDNIEGRAAIEYPGFDAVVEAGLGTGKEYEAFQLHTFPGPAVAAERWARRKTARTSEWTEGYERFAVEAGLDECGRTELGGLQVASSFVGVVTTAMAIGQVLRALHGAAMHGSVSGTLGSSMTPTTIAGQVGCNAVRFGSVPAIADVNVNRQHHAQ